MTLHQCFPRLTARSTAASPRSPVDLADKTLPSCEGWRPMRPPSRPSKNFFQFCQATLYFFASTPASFNVGLLSVTRNLTALRPSTLRSVSQTRLQIQSGVPPEGIPLQSTFSICSSIQQFHCQYLNMVIKATNAASQDAKHIDPIEDIRKLDTIECGPEARKHFALADSYRNLNHGMTMPF